MLFKQVVLLLLVGYLPGYLSALRFNNPVLDNADYPDPGVILFNGTYYAVTTTNSDKPDKIPIHSSKDLQNWKFEGYVINQNNFPAYSWLNAAFWAPEIHYVNGMFHVYFTIGISAINDIGITLAMADNILGPYMVLPKPLHVEQRGGSWDPSIVNSNGNVMLLYTDSNRNIVLRNLTADGMAEKDDIVYTLVTTDLVWEGETVEGAWYVQRNNYHYIFYSANNFCSDVYAVGVARSTSLTGPYEKLRNPILVSDDKVKGPGHGSIVRDVDGQGYVFVHHGYKAGAVCGDNFRLMYSTTVFWGEDNWPKNLIVGA